MNQFLMKFTVRWADLDPNGHVRHSAYYDYGGQARIAYLQQQGVGVDWMNAQGIGMVAFREECRFLRELHYGDDLVIDVRIKSLSADHRKWTLQHRILRGEEVCAVMEVDGAWLDRNKRKILAPPERLEREFASLARTDDFQMLE